MIFNTIIFFAAIAVFAAGVGLLFIYRHYMKKNKTKSRIIINASKPLYWTDCCDEELSLNENHE